MYGKKNYQKGNGKKMNLLKPQVNPCSREKRQVAVFLFSFIADGYKQVQIVWQQRRTLYRLNKVNSSLYSGIPEIFPDLFSLFVVRFTEMNVEI